MLEHFNSTLVRLKHNTKVEFVAGSNDFNSTLVRLKLESEEEVVYLSRISIPHWYD